MFHFLCVLFKRLQDDEKCSNLHMCMLVTHKNGPKIMYRKNDSKSLYYPAVLIYFFYLSSVLIQPLELLHLMMKEQSWTLEVCNCFCFIFIN